MPSAQHADHALLLIFSTQHAEQHGAAGPFSDTHLGTGRVLCRHCPPALEPASASAQKQQPEFDTLPACPSTKIPFSRPYSHSLTPCLRKVKLKGFSLKGGWPKGKGGEPRWGTNDGNLDAIPTCPKASCDKRRSGASKEQPKEQHNPSAVPTHAPGTKTRSPLNQKANE